MKKKTRTTRKQKPTIKVGDIVAYNFSYNDTDTTDWELGIVLETDLLAEDSDYTVRIKFPEDSEDDWYKTVAALEMLLFYKKLVGDNE